MISLRNILVLSISAGLLAACSGPDIGMLENMPNKGTAFEKALHTGYTKLAKDEADEYDMADADHFGDKAARAANGENVKPDRVIDRKVPEKYKAELEKGWQDLVVMRSNDTREKYPEQLAEAQTMYDCWLQEAEEDIQPADISRCHIGFNAAMAEIRNAMKAMPKKEMKKSKPMAKMPGKETFDVYFDFNSAALTPVSHRIVERAAAAIGKGAKAVFVIGNTDTSGDDSYNRKLAARRADAVIAALHKAGVKAPLSKIVAGETNPAMKTGNGVRERLNRRVEITIVR